MTVGPPVVAVVGATGFVGSAVVERLRCRGARVVPVRAPRLAADSDELTVEAATALLRAAIDGCTAAINAAGLPDATATSESTLFGAHAVLAEVVARVTTEARIRLVHVSTAAVQGRASRLDDAPFTAPFSPYSRSKAAGEAAVLAVGGQIVVHRPAGVHGAHRSITRSLAKLSSSRWAFVASPGTDPTPQALVTDVADAIAFLALCDQVPPRIVHQPASGTTTAGLLEALGGRPPRVFPRRLVRLLVRAAFAAGRLRPGLLAQARRVEVLCFGQPQAPSWLTSAGWEPVESAQAWTDLGAHLRNAPERGH